MFLFNHALVVDMLVDAPETPSFAPIVAVRRSVFAKHITASMVNPLKNEVYWSSDIGRDGSVSFAVWMCQMFDYMYAVDNVLVGSCRGGHQKLAELMIAKGAKLWNSGLCYACQGGHRDVAKLMIANGANDWNWGLWGACLWGHRELAELMIEKGATKCASCYWNKASGVSHT